MSIDDSCMFDSIIYDTIHMEFHPRTGLSIYSNLFLPHILSSETFSRDFVHGHISTLISNLIINDVICFASNSSVIYFSTYKWDVYGECRSFNSSTKVYIHYQSLWRRSHKYIGYGWIHAGWDDYQICIIICLVWQFLYSRVRFFDTFIHCRTLRNTDDNVFYATYTVTY